MTIEELKAQRRWIVWQLTKRPDGTSAKEPFSPNGYRASIKKRENWYTYAEIKPIADKFSGIGLILGDLDGTCDYVWGVDLDKCCDATTEAFSPETWSLVMRLDSYTQFSPSGTGGHLWGTGGRVPLSNRGEVIVRPYPGAKQIELKGNGFYYTFNEDRHIDKTPDEIMERPEQLQALINELQTIHTTHTPGIAVSLSEEERFHKLLRGDMSDYKDDHSRADFALCIILAKKYDCNAFRVAEEFQKSKLFRDKWLRDDYRERTITAAIKAVVKESSASVFVPTDDQMDEDGETEFLLNAHDAAKDGILPKGEVNAVGGPSGVGKTSLTILALEEIRKGRTVWGHTVPKARDYRVLLHDRSKKAFKRTAKSLHLSKDAQERVIRLTPQQQKASPAEVLESCIRDHPCAEIWLIEGLDLWMPDANKMSVVSETLDSIQRVATRNDVCVIATVGSPKQKGKDRYFGRDALFGSSALARKLETIVLIGLHDEKDPNSVREMWVLPRTSKAEVLYFKWGEHGLEMIAEPEVTEKPQTGAFCDMEKAIHMRFDMNKKVKYEPSLGTESTFYRWRKWAVENGRLLQIKGEFYLPASGMKLNES